MLTIIERLVETLYYEMLVRHELHFMLNRVTDWADKIIGHIS
jgi:hypothetical protein